MTRIVMQMRTRRARAVLFLAGSMLALGGAFAPAAAQTYAAADYTTYFRYDTARRPVMKIEPDPDGSGSLKRRVEQYVYDVDGQHVRTDVGVVDAVSIDANGVVTVSNFVVASTTSFKYDAAGNKTQTYASVGTDAAALTETSYDADNRAICVAVRMTPTTFQSLYDASDRPNACTAPPVGATNPDRVTKTIYDAAGQTRETIQAVGTEAERTYAKYTYTANGKQETITDANNNTTLLKYDGYDRLWRQFFPEAVRGALAASTTDYEEYQYDANGNRTRLRKRDNTWIDYGYDALGRMSSKSGAAVPAVSYRYDLTGKPKSATFANGDGVTYGYDTAGRISSETLTGRLVGGAQYTRTLGYGYDKAGNRTSLAWPDNNYLSNTLNAAGRLTAVALTTNAAFVTYGYDNLGRRTSARAMGDTRNTDWTFDAANRLKTLTHTLPGQTVAYGFEYSAAGQATKSTVSNSAFVWSGTNSSLTATADGLNRDAAIASLSGGGCAASGKGYDCNGNITNDGYNRTFAYDGENLLTGVNGASLQYDPLGRLIQVTANGSTTQFLYASDKLVAEYDGAGNLLRRYAPSYGVDEAVMWWEGADFSNPRTLHADRQGSVVASVAGSATTIYTYGPYGEPGDRWGAGSRFRYTGQIALPELRLYHYKARAYDPERGWFLQTDPVGYKDDLNLYAYVGGDPLNKTDPTGRTCVMVGTGAGATLSCKVNERGDLTEAQEKIVNKAYTAAANKLLENTRRGDRTAFIAQQGRYVSGREVLQILRTVKVKGSQNLFYRAESDGGNSSPNPKGEKSITVGGISVDRDERGGTANIDHDLQNQFVHEAIHLTKSEPNKIGVLSHKYPYAEAANKLLADKSPFEKALDMLGW